MILKILDFKDFFDFMDILEERVAKLALYKLRL